MAYTIISLFISFFILTNCTTSTASTSKTKKQSINDVTMGTQNTTNSDVCLPGEENNNNTNEPCE